MPPFYSRERESRVSPFLAVLGLVYRGFSTRVDLLFPGIPAQNGENSADPWALGRGNGRNLRNSGVHVLIREIELFRLMLALCNTAFCVGFLVHNATVLARSLVYSGGNLPAVYPRVLLFQKLTVGHFRTSQESRNVRNVRDQGAGT